MGVCSIGFGKLIEMKCTWLQQKRCKWLVDRVDTTRSVLIVHGKELEPRPLSFGYIMGIVDRGLNVEAKGDMQEVGRYPMQINTCDDEFKVKFTLFVLCSLL